jgi:hypothetical protein
LIVDSFDLLYDELKRDNVQIYTKYDYSHKIKTKNKVKSMALGRIWINLIFPDTFQLIDEEVNGSKLKKYLSILYKDYPPETIADTLSILNKECFKLATIIPSSFDINSLILPDFIAKKKKEYLTPDLSPDEFNNRVSELGQELLEYLKSTDSGMYDIIKSGAKGNELLLANLMIAKGSTMDIEGNVSKPIMHSYDEGFDLKEYYSASAEARYTQYQKSV